MRGKLSSFHRYFSKTSLTSSLFKVRKPTEPRPSPDLLRRPNQPGATGGVLSPLTRHYQLVPKTQYDVTWRQFFNPFYVFRRHWELAPLFLLTYYDIGLFIGFPIYFYFNKVDVSWTHGEKRTNISRTMNLRCPTIHKLLVMEPSVYRPWPEMQDVLDAMSKAEAHLAIMASLEGNKGGKKQDSKKCRKEGDDGRRGLC